MIIIRDDKKQTGGGLQIIEMYKRLTDRKDKSPDEIDKLSLAILSHLQQLAVKTLQKLKDDDSTFQYNEYEKQVNTIVETSSNDTFIVRINVVSFQLIVLFTQILPRQTPIQLVFKVKTENSNIYELDYTNYSTIKTFMSRNGFSKLINPKQNDIYMIIGTSYLTVTEMLDSMMDDVFFVGLSFDYIDTDGTIESPFSFAHHDMIHYYNYRTLNDIEDDALLKSFYKFVRRENYNIKLILFLMIHEFQFSNSVYLLPPNIKKDDDSMIILQQFDDEGILLRIHRDLKSLLPKNIKDKSEEEINEFIKQSIKDYLVVLSEFYGFRKINTWVTRMKTIKQMAGKRSKKFKVSKRVRNVGRHKN